jgi:hypothetical protein
MEGPANTLNYMIAGYIVIFGAMILYITSLALRFQHLRQEEKMLLEEDKE